MSKSTSTEDDRKGRAAKDFNELTVFDLKEGVCEGILLLYLQYLFPLLALWGQRGWVHSGQIVLRIASGLQSLYVFPILQILWVPLYPRYSTFKDYIINC